MPPLTYSDSESRLSQSYTNGMMQHRIIVYLKALSRNWFTLKPVLSAAVMRQRCTRVLSGQSRYNIQHRCDRLFGCERLPIPLGIASLKLGDNWA